jgi:hypothetical protein
MRNCISMFAVVWLLLRSMTMGFTASTKIHRGSTISASLGDVVVLASSISAVATTDEEKVAGVPLATSESPANTEDVSIPTNLPSDCGMDYIPLATMLATGQLAEADQVCDTQQQFLHDGYISRLCLT